MRHVTPLFLPVAMAGTDQCVRLYHSYFQLGLPACCNRFFADTSYKLGGNIEIDAVKGTYKQVDLIAQYRCPLTCAPFMRKGCGFDPVYNPMHASTKDPANVKARRLMALEAAARYERAHDGAVSEEATEALEEAAA